MPIPIVPILLFIVIAIISSAAKAKEQQRRQQQAAQRQKQQAFPPVHSAPAPAPAAAPASPAPRPVPQETEAQRRARQEELKRRLEENRRRREQELKREADARRMEDARRIEEQRSRLEKRPMVTTIQTARTEKPVIAHEDDDCGGGSIHDGYHEGSVRRPQAASSAEGMQGPQGARRGVYQKGTTGQGMASAEAVYAASQRGKEAAREAAEYAKESEAHSAIYQSLVSVPEGPRESGADKLQKAIGDKSGIVQGIIWSEVLGRPRAEQQQ
jgi:hypothetical protein